MNPRIILATLLCLLFSGILVAQNKNPFQSIGKKGKILTLSKGQYEELFDQDSIQQIGTALVNVRQMRVVKLLKDEEDHPRAKEEYFKMQIGGLEKLKEPVLTDKWKRITFLYTTGEYLLKAKTINDLVVDGDERQLLWMSLRERAENAQLYKADLPDTDIPPDVLMALLGIKEAEGTYTTEEQNDSNVD